MTCRSAPAVRFTLPPVLPIMLALFVTELSCVVFFVSTLPYEMPTPPELPRPVLTS